MAINIYDDAYDDFIQDPVKNWLNGSFNAYLLGDTFSYFSGLCSGSAWVTNVAPHIIGSPVAVSGRAFGWTTPELLIKSNNISFPSLVGGSCIGMIVALNVAGSDYGIFSCILDSPVTTDGGVNFEQSRVGKISQDCWLYVG